mmetsp:Transcript_11482/g.22031  ORF Transcript_11482/g.22031 Transcript_11482/m.22031 type:complete len:85 (+) Transcript_11482:201-455(+)
MAFLVVAYVLYRLSSERNRCLQSFGTEATYIAQLKKMRSCPDLIVVFYANISLFLLIPLLAPDVIAAVGAAVQYEFRTHNLQQA